MKLRTQIHCRINTKDKKGKGNGFLIPIYNVYDGFIDDTHRPQQVYLTVCHPSAHKGPHLHLKRWGYFTCIKGNVEIIVKIGDTYAVEYSGEDYQFSTIEVPPGVAAMIQNTGNCDAYVINIPSPAWHKDDVDEHGVIEWNPPPQQHKR